MRKSNLKLDGPKSAIPIIMKINPTQKIFFFLFYLKIVFGKNHHQL